MTLIVDPVASSALSQLILEGSPAFTDPARRIREAKAAYATQHVKRSELVGLTKDAQPRSGDLVLAEVAAIGQHARIEQVDGRRAHLHVGDEILVVYGNRYAPDQFEAMVPSHLGPCDLVAAGGMASCMLSCHNKMKRPTSIVPIGLVTDRNGDIVNLADHRLPDPAESSMIRSSDSPWTIVVAGTSMNSGKTTTAAGIIRGLYKAGVRVGAAKVTGTGAGGDIWMMKDAGAKPVLDFTAAGFPSTFDIGFNRTRWIFDFLYGHLTEAQVEVAVIEIADGLFQDETADLLGASNFLDRCDALVFAATDAMGALAGAGHLQSVGLPVRAISGMLTTSPLATREARAGADVPVLSLDDLVSGNHELVPVERSAAASKPVS